jgi:hypothetical protein
MKVSVTGSAHRASSYLLFKTISSKEKEKTYKGKINIDNTL